MKTRLKLSTAAFVLASLGSGVAPAFAQDETAQGDDGGIKEIIVTATRREESLNKIPLAVQALSGDALADLNRFAAFLHDQVPDLAAHVAGELVARTDVLRRHPLLGRPLGHRREYHGREQR